MNSLIEENYLKALFHLSNNGIADVSVKDLSKTLDIKMPTVNSMMRKLASKDLVFYESYKPLRLTPKGILRAALIVRKHRLTEMFLVEKMEFGWEYVHEIAEQIEHIKSDRFFDKMDELLNYPKIDPHGSPIPDRDGNFETISYKKLADFQVGNIVELCAVLNSSDDFLVYLNSKNIALGDRIEITAIENFDSTFTVFLPKDNTTHLFSQLVTSSLLVK